MKARLVQTIVEAVALVAWLALALGGAPMLLSAGVLAVGLTLEHLVASNGFNGRGLFKLGGTSLGALAFLGASETILWVTWLAILQAGHALGAGIFLAATLILQHILEINTFARGRIFKFRGLTRIGDIATFSVVEAVTGGVWFMLTAMSGVAGKVLGAAVLTAGLFYEHGIQGRVLEDNREF
jgi:hypothetical protein